MACGSDPNEHVVLMRRLQQVCKNLPSDFAPYGDRSRDEGGNDCGAGFGCRWFCPVKDAPRHWGVCTNTDSPRAGLLTHERQGCPDFEFRRQ